MISCPVIGLGCGVSIPNWYRMLIHIPRELSPSLVAGVGPWEDGTGKTASVALRRRNLEANAKDLLAFRSCLLEVPPFVIVRDLADPLF